MQTNITGCVGESQLFSGGSNSDEPQDRGTAEPHLVASARWPDSGYPELTVDEE